MLKAQDQLRRQSEQKGARILPTQLPRRSRGSRRRESRKNPTLTPATACRSGGRRSESSWLIATTRAAATPSNYWPGRRLPLIGTCLPKRDRTIVLPYV